MKAISNYDTIKAAPVGGGGDKLKPGAYCVRIEAVNDHSDAISSPYIGIVYNVWDADERQFRFPADEVADPEQQWKHEARIFLTSDWGLRRYKQLVEAVEQTVENNGWRYVNGDGAEQQLVGRWVGLVFRTRLYVPTKGKYVGQARESLDLAAAITAREALEGNYDPSLTETDRWSVDQYAKQHPGWREDGGAVIGMAQPTAPSESDIPF